VEIVVEDVLLGSHGIDAARERILRLERDADLRATLAANGYRRIRTFDWDESAERLERLLGERLAEGRGARV